MVFSFLKVLLDTGHFGVLGVWWVNDGGRISGRSSSFRRFSTASIYFLFGHVCDVVPFFFCSELLYRYGCYINIAGRKPKLAHHHFFFLIPNKHMN
jgi:hypothetical protein